jgi:hypothetical protein
MSLFNRLALRCLEASAKYATAQNDMFLCASTSSWLYCSAPCSPSTAETTLTLARMRSSWLMRSSSTIFYQAAHASTQAQCWRLVNHSKAVDLSPALQRYPQLEGVQQRA